MKKLPKKYFADLILLLGAMIWGVGFYFQKKAAETTSPFCFNGLRYLIAALVILALAKFRLPSTPEGRKYMLLSGVVLFIAGTCQQVGMQSAAIGNASFITAIYIVLVPFLSGLVLRRKIKPINYLAALLSLVGLYLISTSGKGLDRISRGDVILLIGSLFWAIQTLIVDKGVTLADPVQFNAGQFLVAAILHLIAWQVLGKGSTEGLSVSWPYAVASGALVLGVGFTFQAVGQKHTGESEASIIMGLESVFGALSGVLLYHEQFSFPQVTGMVLIFTAVILAVLKN